MHFPERVARKARTTGPRSASWQTFRTSGPRTEHAGTLPREPDPASRATFASPVSEPVASGMAKGGSGRLAGSPRDPGASPPTLWIVLIEM
jgi:hypothetical protein